MKKMRVTFDFALRIKDMKRDGKFIGEVDVDFERDGVQLLIEDDRDALIIILKK